MRSCISILMLSVTLIAALANIAQSSQPTYGEYKLDFARKPVLGVLNELVARFVFWKSCAEGELIISIPTIRNEPPRKVSCWKGAIVSNDTILASIRIPALPRGAFQFTAECRTTSCGGFSAEAGGAAVCVWVTSEGTQTAPFGYYFGLQDTIFNHLELEKLGKATKQEIRKRSPQVYRIMYNDFSIPSEGLADPLGDSTLVPKPSAKPDSGKPEGGMGVFQGVPEELPLGGSAGASELEKAKRYNEVRHSAPADNSMARTYVDNSQARTPRIRDPIPPRPPITIVADTDGNGSMERAEEVRLMRESHGVGNIAKQSTAAEPVDSITPDTTMHPYLPSRSLQDRSPR